MGRPTDYRDAGELPVIPLMAQIDRADLSWRIGAVAVPRGTQSDRAVELWLPLRLSPDPYSADAISLPGSCPSEPMRTR